MKKTIVLAIAVLLWTTAARAAPKPTLAWGSVINSGACSMDGDLVVNVVLKVTNDVDSGTAGNYWAYDDFNKTIQIWSTATPGVFCVRVMYLGSFHAIAGVTSPGGGGALSGAEKGSFEGGYFGTVTGTLSPAWPTHGMVGSFDYACAADGSSCPGAAAANWLTAYFGATGSLTMTWWGWIYHGGRYGTWSNAISQTVGDILAQ